MIIITINNFIILNLFRFVLMVSNNYIICVVYSCVCEFKTNIFSEIQLFCFLLNKNKNNFLVVYGMQNINTRVKNSLIPLYAHNKLKNIK